MKTDFDILIVGSGLVGMTLAVALAKSLSLKIAILDKNNMTPDINNKLRNNNLDRRSIALAYPSICMFNSLGLWDKLGKNITFIEEIHVSDKGKYAQVRMNAKQEDLPFLGAVIEMTSLMKVLTDTVKSLNIEMITPASVTNLIDRGESYSLAIKTETGLNNLQAKLIIAVDGQDSNIREWLKIPVKKIDYHQSALICNVRLKRAHANIAYERFIKTGVMAMLPITNDSCGCVWTMPPDDVMIKLALAETDFLKLLQQEFGYRLGRFIGIGKRQVFPLHLIHAKEMFKRNILLFGNAAHFLHPVSGQGFNLSLRDIGDLIDTLVMNPLTDNNESLLKSYSAKRQQDQNRTIKVTNSLINIFGASGYKNLRLLGMLAIERSNLAKQLTSKLMMGKMQKTSSLTQIKVI